MPEDSQKKPGTFLGLRNSALIEIGLFLIIAEGIDYLFFGGSRYWLVRPHPFWAIVLLISVQYGTMEGLVAAVAATAALLVANLPEQSLDQDIYDYLLGIIGRPLMWFSAAVVIGELRMRQVYEREELRSDLSAAMQREQTIANAYRHLESAKESLETLVAGQLRTMTSVYRAANSLGKLDPGEALRGASAMVRAVMNPPQFSLFLLSDNALGLAVSEGWAKTGDLSRSFTRQSPLFREVIERRRMLSRVNSEDEVILEHEGFLAGPLIDMDSGKVVGMLKIERVQFFELNLSALESFKILCEWIGTALSNAHRHELAQSSAASDPEKSALFYNTFFKRQLELLTALAKEVGFDVFMLVARLVNASAFTTEKQELIHATMGHAVKDALRGIDLAFTYQRTSCESVIALPAAKMTDAQTIADKVRASLSELLKGKANGARFSVVIQAVHRRGEQRERSGLAEGQVVALTAPKVAEK